MLLIIIFEFIKIFIFNILFNLELFLNIIDIMGVIIIEEIMMIKYFNFIFLIIIIVGSINNGNIENFKSIVNMFLKNLFFFF